MATTRPVPRCCHNTALLKQCHCRNGIITSLQKQYHPFNATASLQAECCPASTQQWPHCCHCHSKTTLKPPQQCCNQNNSRHNSTAATLPPIHYHDKNKTVATLLLLQFATSNQLSSAKTWQHLTITSVCHESCTFV